MAKGWEKNNSTFALHPTILKLEESLSNNICAAILSTGFQIIIILCSIDKGDGDARLTPL